MRTIEEVFIKMPARKKLKLAWLLITSAVIDIIADTVIWLLGGSRRK